MRRPATAEPDERRPGGDDRPWLYSGTLVVQGKGVAEVVATGKRVVVIGGGDTGTDCVGTSLRQGALSVTQFEILPKPPPTRCESTPWPEWPYMLRSSSSHEEGGTALVRHHHGFLRGIVNVFQPGHHRPFRCNNPRKSARCCRATSGGESAKSDGGDRPSALATLET